MSLLLFLFRISTKIPGLTRILKWLKRRQIERKPIQKPQQVKLEPKLIDDYTLQLHSQKSIILQGKSNQLSLVFANGPVQKSVADIVEPNQLNKQGIGYSIGPDLDIEIINDGLFLSNNNRQIMVLEISQQDEWTRLDFVSNHLYIFGLGEKNGLMDKTNLDWIFWNTDNALFEPKDDPLYKSYPTAVIKYEDLWAGLIVDYPGFQKWNLKEEETIQLLIESTGFSLHILVGPTPDDIIKAIYQLTGKMDLPPLWSLGYHQCRWSYFPKERVLEVIQDFRSKNIPLDAIYLDIDYMDQFRCFTWDPKAFDDPEDLIKTIHGLNCHVICMIDPGIKVDPQYFVYEQMMRNKYYCTKNGKAFVSPVWPGDAIFPDFFDISVKDWWGRLYQPFVHYGVDGFWNDMNEPTTFTLLGTMPDNVSHKVSNISVPHSKVHNLYGQMMTQASFEGLQKLRPEKRVFLLSRSAYLGSQRFGWIWTGDNKASWSHLQQSLVKLLNSGISGHFASGADIGGFRENPSPELFARWIQLGAFYPLFRTHSSKFSDDQEPWSYGKQVETISKKFIRLRYRLLPYIYTWFWYGCETGIPLMRPLWFENPDHPQSYHPSWVNTQFFFGPSLLVAPVLTKNNTRKIYLPMGTWHNYFTEKQYKGDRILEYDVELESTLMFVKDKSIVPHYKEAGQNAEMTKNSGLEFKTYGSDCIGHIYLDDGDDLSYKEGNYGFYEIDDKLNLTLIQGNGFNQ